MTEKNTQEKTEDKYINQIFWLDKNVNKANNIKYQEQIKNTFPNMELNTFDNFDEGFKKIKKNRFKYIYLIISGPYFKSYVEKFNEEIEEFTHIPITIIFTSKNFQDVLLQKKTDKFIQLDDKIFKAIRNPIYNIGYMETDIKKIIKFIEEFEINLDETYENIDDFDRDYQSALTFETISSIKDLVLPSLYRHLQNDNIYKKEVQEMDEFILKRYQQKKIKNVLLPLKKFNIEIPTNIMVKLWIYIYTCESFFYKELNLSLMKNKGDIYQNFIKMLYNGLKVGSLKINCRDKLYRCCLLGKDEVNKLEELDNNPPEINLQDTSTIPLSLVYSRAFLSFSKKKESALRFLRTDDNLVPCILEVNGLDESIKENEFYSSNAEISKFSVFPGEEEILFFPFSSFIFTQIVDDIEEKKDKKGNILKKIPVKRITLEYLGKFKKDINDVIKKVGTTIIMEEQKKKQFCIDMKTNIENQIKQEKKRELRKTKTAKTETTQEESIEYMSNNKINFEKHEEIETFKMETKKINEIINEKIEGVIEDKKDELNTNKFKKDKFIEFKSEPEKLKLSNKLKINCLSDYSDNQFCLFNSVDKKILLVYITGKNEDIKNCLGYYDLETSEDTIIEKVHEKNILCVRHYVKNNEDLILTTSYDNSLKILNVTQKWKCEVHIKKIGENEGFDNNYYLYSASLLTLENKNDDNKNEHFIIVTSYNDDEIKIYNYETKKLIKTINDKYGYIFLDTYYDEKLNKNYIICSKYIDSETNENGEEEEFIKIFDFNTKEIYLEIKKFAQNVIIRKISNYNEENTQVQQNESIENYNKDVSLIFASNNSIYVYDFYTKESILNIDISNAKHLHCVCLWNKNYIIVGGDKKDNKIHIINLDRKKETQTINGYNIYTFAKIKDEEKNIEKLYCQELENKGIIIFQTAVE
jgi:hypothetical protein